MDISELILSGDVRGLARAITLVENEASEAVDIIRSIYPRTGQAHVIGVTGAPGVGKSTLVDRLAIEFRKAGLGVGIIAVDPTSPFTGGALLGDRLRMQDSTADPGVYMRSLATRGHLGGLSRATGDVIRLLDAFGKEIVLVETVGAGQSEVDIMKYAHTTVIVLAPGLGDEIQAIKAGIMEIGDVFAVNKADREGAERTVAELEMMLDLGGDGARARDGGGRAEGAEAASRWRPAVVRTIARDGTGIADLAGKIQDHLAHLRQGPGWQARARQRGETELREIIAQRVVGEVVDRAGRNGLWEAMVDGLAERRIDPYTAAERILARLREHGL